MKKMMDFLSVGFYNLGQVLLLDYTVFENFRRMMRYFCCQSIFLQTFVTTAEGKKTNWFIFFICLCSFVSEKKSYTVTFALHQFNTSFKRQLLTWKATTI